MELELNVDDISTAHKAAVRGNKEELENVLNVSSFWWRVTLQMIGFYIN